MGYDRAQSQRSARSGTRIPALLPDASQAAGTFRIHNAFRPTIRRASCKSGQARTGRGVADVLTDRVRSARRRDARIWFHHRLNRSRSWNFHKNLAEGVEGGIGGLTGDRVASGERIAGVAWLAAAYRTVIDDAAFGVQAAGAGTGVGTLLIHASSAQGTFGTYDALRSTAGRGSDVGRKAGTYGLLVDFATLAVGSAR